MDTYTKKKLCLIFIKIAKNHSNIEAQNFQISAFYQICVSPDIFQLGFAEVIGITVMLWHMNLSCYWLPKDHELQCWQAILFIQKEK